ncbi:MAG TPA: ABC transporter ATP-binding protein [candidate division Zixibacteria bacterium]|nr:ABC transporter ATP-binding protein [candidate division Zixibacteria bacterium]MDD4917619.1 ABC transporter ATP-binding protein [candidate division Zixibacteria bacterium]MDM7972122.1 ABC transporter ATP-binding protein [candidate division Zixibacteria bacterium]HOD66764.1 ABC transporter ATP-binding protein [candidate division Zixibacteria bacterium]HPI33655.1 ABC transporter ATP-binding protein [candidate division Zixibacteria bacterium]
MAERAAVVLEQVTFGYDSEPAVEEASFAIGEREYVWIVGPNGGGKTTLVKLILGLLQPRRGTVRVFGAPPEEARHRIGYMPQHARLDPKFPVTVFEVALMGRLGPRRWIGRYRRADRKAALRALDQVGLADMRNRNLAELSGGQQRRLLIARALAAEPELLLLDEPMANLDIRGENELTRLLQELNNRLTIIMVSHDPAFVAGSVKRVVCVKRRVHTHPTATLDSGFMRELYGTEFRVVRHDVEQGSGEGAA